MPRPDLPCRSVETRRYEIHFPSAIAIAKLQVSDEEARSLAQAIQDCSDKLKTGRRPTRRQIAHLLLLEEGWDGNTFFVDFGEQLRIAHFCKGGRFHIEFA
jgi:hypothetical protein